MLRNTLLITLLTLPLLGADDKAALSQLYEAIGIAASTHNADAYIKLLTEDYQQVTHSGRIRDRKAAYEAVKNGPSMPADIRFEEVSLSIHGDSAIRILLQSWTNSAGKSVKGYITWVFVKEHGIWKLAGEFSTDIPSDAK
jgi:ketosteroid isomerase-like protein